RVPLRAGGLRTPGRDEETEAFLAPALVPVVVSVPSLPCLIVSREVGRLPRREGRSRASDKNEAMCCRKRSRAAPGQRERRPVARPPRAAARRPRPVPPITAPATASQNAPPGCRAGAAAAATPAPGG